MPRFTTKEGVEIDTEKGTATLNGQPLKFPIGGVVLQDKEISLLPERSAGNSHAIGADGGYFIPFFVQERPFSGTVALRRATYEHAPLDGWTFATSPPAGPEVITITLTDRWKQLAEKSIPTPLDFDTWEIADVIAYLRELSGLEAEG